GARLRRPGRHAGRPRPGHRLPRRQAGSRQGAVGRRPTLIECLVDRLGAHSSEDDQRRYRSQEELEQLAKNDCLEQFRRRLLEEGILSEAEVDQYQEEVREEITRATRQGIDSPDASPEDALTNVYSDDVPAPIEPAP